MSNTPKNTVLASVLASGSHGRKFTEAEEQVIIDAIAAAKKAGSTVTIAAIRNAVAKYNTEHGDEERTRAAVVQAIERLAKAGKADKAVIASGENARVKYTDAETKLIQDLAVKAQAENKRLTVSEIHAALVAAKISPKERSLPSVRAHVQNMLKGNEAVVDDAPAANAG